MAELLIGDVFANLAVAVPDRVAAIHREATISYGELDRRGRALARVLAEDGDARGSGNVGRGDRVVVWADTTLDQLPVFVALARLGAVYAPVSGLLTVDEAAHTLARLRPSLLLVDAAHAQDAPSLADRLGHVPVREITGCAARDLIDGQAAPPGDLATAMAEVLAADGFGDGRPAPGQVRAAELGVEPGLGGSARIAGVAGGERSDRQDGVGLSERDAHVIFFTSGSTGAAKGVVLSHRVSWLRSHPGALLEPRGVAVCPYPLFHMAAWTFALQQWHARGTVVFTTGDAADICRAIDRHRASRLNAIPAVWRRIADYAASPEGQGLDLTSVRVADTGTSATPPDLLATIRATMPKAAVRVFYGTTETGAVTMLADEDVDRKPGSAGVVAPFTEIRLADGAVDADADGGELQVRGPQVFDRYEGDPEATAAAFTDDGWYRTGDLARQDDEGFLSIVGRVGSLIRTGGEAVVPEEVEAVLRGHPAIADVAAVGVPDPAWGEVVCAAIVLADGAAAPTVDELAAHCGSRLARFKRPRRIVVLDEIPRTASTGQIQRRRIVESLSAGSSEP